MSSLGTTTTLSPASPTVRRDPGGIRAKAGLHVRSVGRMLNPSGTGSRCWVQNNSDRRQGVPIAPAPSIAAPYRRSDPQWKIDECVSKAPALVRAMAAHGGGRWVEHLGSMKRSSPRTCHPSAHRRPRLRSAEGSSRSFLRSHRCRSLPAPAERESCSLAVSPSGSRRPTSVTTARTDRRALA